MSALLDGLRRLKIVDTTGADVAASTGSRLLWLVLIWCVSVGLLGAVGYVLRLVLKP